MNLRRRRGWTLHTYRLRPIANWNKEFGHPKIGFGRSQSYTGSIIQMQSDVQNVNLSWSHFFTGFILRCVTLAAFKILFMTYKKKKLYYLLPSTTSSSHIQCCISLYHYYSIIVASSLISCWNILICIRANFYIFNIWKWKRNSFSLIKRSLK